MFDYGILLVGDPVHSYRVITLSPSQFDFLNLFVRSPGDLIYFLAVVVVSQAAFFMALGQRLRRKQDTIARRYTLAAGAVVVVWALMMLGALFALLSGRGADAILPPLERAAAVSTILLIAWAFLTADHDHWGRAPNLVLQVLIGLVIVGYLATAFQWPQVAGQVDFNLSQFGIAWTFVPAVLCVVGIVICLAYFRLIVDAPLKLLYFAVLLIGYGFTLAEMLQGAISGDYAGPARLAFLASLPILPSIIYRTIIGHYEQELADSLVSATNVDSRPLSARPATSELNLPANGNANERESVQLMRALGLILENATPANIPERIIMAATQVLQADIGALLAVHDANYADVMAAHDRMRQRDISGIPLNLDAQPTLVNAIERRLQRPLFTDRNRDELRDLYTRLDIEQTGPTYFQPLVNGKELLSVLVIGLPYSERELTPQEQELLKGIGIIASNLLALSYAAEDARVRSEERVIQAMVQGVTPDQVNDDSVMKAWQEMQASLEASREQIDLLTRQITTLKLQLDDERTRMAGTLGDSKEGLSISQRLLSMTEEQQKLVEDRDRLAARLREAETALLSATSTGNESVFKAMVDVLNRERDELVRQRDRLETQLTEMRSSGDSPEPQTVSDMIDRMGEEKTQIEAERDELNSRLADIEAQLKALGIEDNDSGLSQLVRQLYEQRTSLQARVDLLQRERDALLNERNRLVFDDQSSPDEVRDKLQTEIRYLAADREAITKQHDKLRSERDELLAKQDLLKQQRARLTAEVAGFEQELAESYEDQTRLRTQLQQVANQRSALATERDRLLAERQALEAELSQRAAGSTSESRERAEAESVGALTQMIESITAERDRLQQQQNELENRLAEREQELEQLQRRTEAWQDALPRLESPDLFVGMVQELRTPLTSIVGYVDLMINESAGILGEMQRKFLQRIDANITRLDSMLDDLVRVTVIDSGQFSLVPEPVDVVGVIEDAITNATKQLREKGLTIHLNLDDDVPPLRVDADAISQIIGQLLTNAYLVTPPGSEIYVTARRQPVKFAGNGTSFETDSLFVSVEDRGGGIASEDQPRVFSRKYKAENPLIQGLGDTGVGLSIAKALVEAHGGRIWLETHDQLGSAFNFALPVDTALEAQR